MAQKVTVKAKPPINIEKLVMWKMTDEDNETYGSVMDFDRRIMSFRDTLAVNSTSLYVPMLLPLTLPANVTANGICTNISRYSSSPTRKAQNKSLREI